MKSRLTAYSNKDIGGRDEQQDSVIHLLSSDGSRALLVVADGMGGHSGGKMASACIFTTAKIEWKDSKEAIRISSDIILSNIFKRSYNCMRTFEKKQNTSPRSACVALLIKENTAYYAHVGDSRLYHFRNGMLFNKTKDHSVVQMLVDMEQIHEEDMATHEDQGKLLKWIGGKKEPDPTIANVDIMAGDQFLLCSDGLWEYVKENQMENVLNKTSDLKKAANLFIKWAKESGGDKGDNISVALLTVNKINKSSNLLLLISGVLLLVLSFLTGYYYFTPNSTNKEKTKEIIIINNNEKIEQSK